MTNLLHPWSHPIVEEDASKNADLRAGMDPPPAGEPASPEEGPQEGADLEGVPLGMTDPLEVDLYESTILHPLPPQNDLGYFEKFVAKAKKMIGIFIIQTYQSSI